MGFDVGDMLSNPLNHQGSTRRQENGGKKDRAEELTATVRDVLSQA
jgi:hypothetical protein